MEDNNNTTTMINYLHIDHFSRMRFISEEEYVKLSSLSEFSFLSFMDDDIGKEINRFFEMIIPNNKDDLLNICLTLTDKYKSLYTTKTIIDDSVNRILAIKNNMELSLNTENANDIALILAYAFGKIQHSIIAYRNGLIDNEINYDIFNYEQLLGKVNQVLLKNIDVVNYFVNKNRIESAQNEGSINYNDVNFYQYPYLTKEMPKKIEKTLPVEMIILINKFQYIRKLYLSIDDIDSKKNEELLIILLNNKWLFPNVIEIELDLANDPLQQKLDQIFQYKLNNENKLANRYTKTTKYNTSYKSKCKWNPNIEEMSIMLQNEDNYFSSNQCSFYPSMFDYEEDETLNQDDIKSVRPKNTSLIRLNSSKSSRESQPQKKHKHHSSKNVNCEDESKSLTKFVVNNQETFKTIIIYSYFISNMPRVNVLSLIFQDSFNEEINIMLQSNNIIMMNFSFLNFISKMDWLYNLSLDFNSLNMKTFEKLTTLIHKNKSLSCLRLNFFVNENQYSPSGLYKLAEELGIKTKFLTKEKESTNNQKALTYEPMDVDIILINKLVNNFAENIQKLFFVIQSKQNLKEISLYFDIPSVLIYDDSYSLILLKFMVNFLLFLTNEPNRFNKVDIVAPYLKLDNRRFPIIEELFEEINLYNDDIKYNNTIKHLVIQIQMYKIINIKKLISLNLMKLFLGDLDKDTFDCFLQHYTSEHFQSNSALVSVKISLSIIEVVYEDIEELIMLYLKTKPKKLYRQDLITSLKFKSKENMRKLLDVIYNENKVKQTYVEIAVTNKEILHECYKDLEREKIDQLTAISLIFMKKNLFNDTNINNAVYKDVKEYLLPTKNKKLYCKNF